MRIANQAKAAVLAVSFAALTLAAPLSAAQAEDSVKLNLLGTYKTGIFDESAAEIPAYDPANKKLYVVNSHAGLIDILDLSNPADPKKIGELSVADEGKVATSVAVYEDRIAVAVSNKQDPGKAVIFDLSGKKVAAMEIGANPDMLTFTPDGRYVLVANEGEPSKDYTNDPVGSVSVINMSDLSVKTAGFEGFEKADLPEGMRLAHPTATVAQDVEPEYVAISGDSKTAYVSLQENNALAVVDIASAKVTKLLGLGYKDWSKLPMDASNKDGGINFSKWPVFGMYQPDAIAAYDVDGKTYIISANEGDARDYDGYSEETRAGKMDWDAEKWPNASELKEKVLLGRIKISSFSSDTDGDGDLDKIMAYGARSFSIWDAEGNQVFDSGSEMEMVTSKRLGGNFNSDNDEGDSGDSRSDDKGPEPEGVTLGTIDGKTYAFIGLERVGGVMVYDVTSPAAPSFVGYENNRDFSGDVEKGTAGDLGPEGLIFISADQSPNGKNLLVVANEVSGSTSVFEVVVK